MVCFLPLAVSLAGEGGPLKKGHPKLESALSELQERYLSQGKGQSQEFARRRDLRIDNHDNVLVFILPQAGKTRDSIDVQALRGYGVEIVKSGEAVLKAKVPIMMLDVIAERVKGISFIKLPDRPLPLYVSQGVNLTGASSYQFSGYTGQGAKVAIIDLGFSGVTAAINAGELPASAILIDCTGTECVGTDFASDLEVHGTACAEIVYDMAPGAELFLIKVDDEIDLVHAKDFCIANGINIITHSVGWFNTNFYDGTCYFDNAVCSADHAYRNGILWVNAAGNEGLSHYEALFTDLDGDLFHNVTDTSNFIALNAFEGDIIVAAMTWDAWPATDQDYDLYLYDVTGTPVAASLSWQWGGGPPSEGLAYRATYFGPYYLAVYKYHTAGNYRFKIFSYYHDLDPHVASSSIGSPADARGALAVAAIDWRNWQTGPQEDFSSQGPTTDGRLKPDVSAPDWVSSFTYAVYGGFPGTSAASPHVAGAAALILSNAPDLTVAQLWDAVTSMAIDMGSPGPDPVYGYGRLNLYTIYVSPLSINFGEVLVEAVSDQVVTVYNIGADSLEIGAIGAPMAPFQVLADDCSGRSLPLGGSCTFGVRFSPSAYGDFSTSLEVPSNDPYRNPVTVVLNGVGRHEIALTSPSFGAGFAPCSLDPLPTFWWNAVGSQFFSSYELQFSADPGFSTVPVKLWAAGNVAQKSVTPGLWRKVSLIPGREGGPVYWRVVGARSDGTQAESDVRWFLIESPQSVGDATISPTSKSLLPTLSWQNNCNVKFKVRFGSDPAFSRRRTLYYTASDPNGWFGAELSQDQWLSIRNLVADEEWSTIYWYVESWDTANRYSSSSLMDFVLTE